MIKNGKIVGHLDELGMGSAFCTTKGLVLLLNEGLTVSSVHFMNFDRPSCAALGVTSITGVCNHRCGGWSANSLASSILTRSNKAGFRWEHEVVLIDVDGSLTGNVFISDKIFLELQFSLTQTSIVIAYSDESYLVPKLS